MRKGLVKDGIFIGAMNLPERKKPALVVQYGNKVEILGTFIDEWRVNQWMDTLKEMFKDGDK